MDDDWAAVFVIFGRKRLRHNSDNKCRGKEA